MNAQGSTQPETPAVLLTRLSETAAKVQADDLTELAQMHGWCESLTDTWRGGAAAQQPLADQAASLMTRLEKLILDEVEDAVLAAAGIAAQVAELYRQYDPATESDNASPPEPAAEMAPVVEAAPEPPPAPPAPPATAPSSTPAYQASTLILNDKELDFVRGFVDEACEHIEAIEAAVLEVERTPEDTAKINDLFRPFHTIKGAAGFLNLTDINSLTHEAETLLDQARKGQRPITPGIIDLVFDVVDILKAQIAGIATHLKENATGPVPQPPIAGMVARLRDVVANRTDPQAKAPSGPAGRKTGEFLVEQANVPPAVVEMALDLQTREPQRKTGEILMDMGTATARQVHQAIRAQSAASSPAPAPAEKAPAAATQPASAPTGGGAASSSANAVNDQSLRIDIAKLDALVDMVGELVIAQTLVSASPQVTGDVRLSKDVGRVAKILRNLQEVTLAMRMVPIGATFQKMARLVRDVSRKAGKQVELTISGEDTELDKNVIQQIGDPLVHMVRNAIDHGVESPEARAAAGKSAVGHVHLGACHQAGNIIIEIRDDGKGLDAQKLIAKGIEKGLVAPGAELSEAEAFALIFAPGFSTAEKITDISGRGVGMDVVKRNIDKLRGKIEITSVKGQGTTFRIRLPLTLAIIDGMIVRVGTQRFIIPTITLQQSLRPTADQIATVQHRGEMVQVRGQLIPLIQLGTLFRVAQRTEPTEGMVVIANSDGNPVGLVVDELIGQQQVVIKSLGSSFEGLRGISGAAILGDGRVGLILEITGLEALNSAGPVTKSELKIS